MDACEIRKLEERFLEVSLAIVLRCARRPWQTSNEFWRCFNLLGEQSGLFTIRYSHQAFEFRPSAVWIAILLYKPGDILYRRFGILNPGLLRLLVDFEISSIKALLILVQEGLLYRICCILSNLFKEWQIASSSLWSPLTIRILASAAGNFVIFSCSASSSTDASISL